MNDGGLRAQRHPNDNEGGDPMVDWSTQASAHSGGEVTLYDRFGRTAYIADVREGSTITRPEKLKVLARVRAKGKLSAGEKVAKVMLVVPRREDAVALAHLVQKGNVDAVVYPETDGPGRKLMRDPNVLGESRLVPWPAGK